MFSVCFAGGRSSPEAFAPDPRTLRGAAGRGPDAGLPGRAHRWPRPRPLPRPHQPRNFVKDPGFRVRGTRQRAEETTFAHRATSRLYATAELPCRGRRGRCRRPQKDRKRWLARARGSARSPGPRAETAPRGRRLRCSRFPTGRGDGGSSRGCRLALARPWTPGASEGTAASRREHTLLARGRVETWPSPSDQPR